MNSFDLFGYHLLNQMAGHVRVLDSIMSFLAQYALEIYAILFVLAWFTAPKSEVKQRHALVVMGLAGVLALLINVVIGHIWYRPRPFITLQKGTFTQLIPHAVDSSFPSDHTAGSFGFAAGAWKRATGWVSKGFTVLAILVGIARIYVGVHWPTDVIAGAVVGMLSARIMRRYSQQLKPLTNFALRLFKMGTYSQGGRSNNVA